jgi:hypothetical protein
MKPCLAAVLQRMEVARFLSTPDLLNYPIFSGRETWSPRKACLMGPIEIVVVLYGVHDLGARAAEVIPPGGNGTGKDLRSLINPRLVGIRYHGRLLELAKD